MKTVYLVRHAKSSWDYPHLDDRDRPLKGRGMRDAHLMADYVTQQSDVTPRLYSSPATRAVHTAMIFARHFQIPLDSVSVKEELYESSSDQIRDFLQGMPLRDDSVMIFGHNPTFEEFIDRCLHQPLGRVPTAAVACLHFPVADWKDLDFEAELLFFDFPKNLKAT
ncbi:MAG: histidine phosphatase family protein [Schleiferiaceae bacterium]|nr:histidine phosphatase family protein [Schleiferiaceae bacterium]